MTEAEKMEWSQNAGLTCAFKGAAIGNAIVPIAGGLVGGLIGWLVGGITTAVVLDSCTESTDSLNHDR